MIVQCELCETNCKMYSLKLTLVSKVKGSYVA
jgi:hypothetical protein